MTGTTSLLEAFLARRLHLDWHSLSLSLVGCTLSYAPYHLSLDGAATHQKAYSSPVVMIIFHRLVATNSNDLNMLTYQKDWNSRSFLGYAIVFNYTVPLFLILCFYVQVKITFNHLEWWISFLLDCQSSRSPWGRTSSSGQEDECWIFTFQCKRYRWQCRSENCQSRLSIETQILRTFPL